MDYSQLTDEELKQAYTDKSQQVSTDIKDERIETVMDAVSGFGQAATFNLGDEFYSAASAGYDWLVNDDPFMKNYDALWASEQIRIKNANIRSPIASTAGELAAIAPSLGRLAVMKAPVITSAIFGAGQGFGRGGDMESRLDNATTSGAIYAAGALVPGAIAETAGKGGMVRNFISKVADKVAPKSGFGGKVAKYAVDNPAKAALGTAAAMGAAGMPIAAGMTAAAVPLAKAAAKFPKTSSVLPIKSFEDVVDYQVRDFDPTGLTDEELIMMYEGEEPELPDYSSMSDEEIMELYRQTR